LPSALCPPPSALHPPPSAIPQKPVFSMKKIITTIVVLLLLLLAGGALYVNHLARRALPDYNADIRLEGLEAEVQVVRDAHGVPTIYAENEGDLYRAVGYVMAQDRLWQMDVMRRAALGRLAEVVGEDYVDADLLVRSLRLQEKTMEVLQHSPAEVVAAMEAFADGVNQYIAHAGNRLPPEFAILRYRPEPWEARHSVSLVGLMAWQVGGEWSTELVLKQLREVLDEARFLELIPDTTLHRSYVHPKVQQQLAGLFPALERPSRQLEAFGANALSGSNSWVVIGERSATGLPLFAHDMHLVFFVPSVWYPMQQVIPGKLHVSGVVLPGQPLVIAGRNKDIAWGTTSVMVDDNDFYLETIHPDNPNKYLYLDEWHEMDVRTERIYTGADTFVDRELRFTHRGPVVSDLHDMNGAVISMRWMGNEYSNEVKGVYQLNRARDWETFRGAVSHFRAISQNFTYADVHGNIGVQTAAGIPIREGSGVLVKPGEDDTFDWQGEVPFDALPYTFNPPEGFVIAANQRTVPGDFPYYISHWFDLPYRHDRIHSLLQEKERFTVEDFRAIMGDKRSRMALGMLPALLDAVELMPGLTATEQKALTLLQQWDASYHPEQAAPLVFETYYVTFIEMLMREALGDTHYDMVFTDKMITRNLVARVWEQRESAWLPQQFDYPFTALVQSSFREAILRLIQEHGNRPGRWAWGDAHQLVMEHPMGHVGLIDRLMRKNIGEFTPGGSFHTVAPYSYNPNKPFGIIHGASHRHIYSTADWDASYSIIPTGVSGLPASPYYRDQARLFVEDDYRQDLFSFEAVTNSAAYQMRFIPENSGQ
jgi:penicillin G amidase